MAVAVPAGTPDRDIGRKPLPATGPYRTRSFSPGRSWLLVRNPRFRQWSSEAQPEGYPDRIVLEASRGTGQVAAVERGSADVLLTPPLSRVDELARRYANQLRIDPLGATFALVMNTRVAPFDRLAVRRALNYAVDRNRIARLTGSSLTAKATCQILAPTLPGYRPYCPYTLDPSPSGSWTAPDLAKAEHLVAGSGTRGMEVTLLVTPPLPAQPTLQIGRYVVSVLDRLGYRASLEVYPTPTRAASPIRAAGPRSGGSPGSRTRRPRTISSLRCSPAMHFARGAPTTSTCRSFAMAASTHRSGTRARSSRAIPPPRARNGAGSSASSWIERRGCRSTTRGR
jgi:ABC-type transport system substrate-binding protein